MFGGGITSELTGPPPANTKDNKTDQFDEKLAGGGSGPTICCAASNKWRLRFNELFSTLFVGNS